MKKHGAMVRASDNKEREKGSFQIENYFQFPVSTSRKNFRLALEFFTFFHRNLKFTLTGKIPST